MATSRYVGNVPNFGLGSKPTDPAAIKVWERTHQARYRQTAESKVARLKRASRPHQIAKVAARRKSAKERAYQRAYQKTAKYLAKVKIRRRAERATPVGRLNNRMRAAFHRYMKRGQKGGRPWRSLVGYSLADLKRHLERQFTRGMSWENMGKWHIDHILPLSSFTYSDPADPDFRVAWALANLRPLWGQENQKKSASREMLL